MKASFPSEVAFQYACPRHPTVSMCMSCPRCRRVFEEHTARIAQLPKVEKS